MAARLDHREDFPGFDQFPVFRQSGVGFKGQKGDAVIKTVVGNRRMDRAARLLVYQGEAEGPVSAEAPPWQGVKMLVAAPQIVFGAIIKFNNYHSQGMSKAKVRGMPQSEVSGKSTATAECEARAARRLSRRRREIFWRKGAAAGCFLWDSCDFFGKEPQKNL